MPLTTWYVVLFSFGAGASIILFWSVVLARGALPRLLPGPGARGHVLAELLTGVMLMAGGIALLVDHDATWAVAVSALGLGALVYALAGSPGMYPGNRMLRAAFGLGWVFALPAIASLLASTR